MINTQNTTFKPPKPFQFHPDFKGWGGVVYTEETVNGKRHYTIDGVRYPSITTVLSYDPLKQMILSRWRKRVGEQEAARISSHATHRGKSLHKLCEEYITKNEIQTKTYEERENFFKVKSDIERLGRIFCVETPLFSRELGVAGRCDLIAEFGSGDIWVPAVIDFKTSTKAKYRKDISHYFIQGAAYALMFEEMTGIKVPEIVIMIATEEVQGLQLFGEKTENWIAPLKQAIMTYKEQANVKEIPACGTLDGI